MSKKTYSEKLLDPRWQQMRLRVFERDGWACVVCWSKAKTLNAHHTHYHPYAEGPWDYDIDTIKTLCKECHSHVHMDFQASKANLLLALSKIDIWKSTDYDIFCDVFSVVTREDLIDLFLRKSNGSDQNC